MRPLSAETRRDGVEVVIGGEGGDEIFAAPELAIADRLARGAFADAARLVSRFPNRAYHPGWRTGARLWRDFGAYPLLPPRVHARMIRAAEGADIPPHLAARWHRPLLVVLDPQPWRNVDGPRWWSARADEVIRRSSMIGAAELILRSARLRRVLHRHPLLDFDLVNWAMQLPPEISFDPRGTRPVLRQAIRGLVPDSVRLSPQKATFDAVRGYSLQEDAATVRRLVLADDARVREYTRSDAVAELLGQVPGTWGELSQWSGRVWRLVTIECWLRQQEDSTFARRLLDSGELIQFHRSIER